MKEQDSLDGSPQSAYYWIVRVGQDDASCARARRVWATCNAIVVAKSGIVAERIVCYMKIMMM